MMLNLNPFNKVPKCHGVYMALMGSGVDNRGPWIVYQCMTCGRVVVKRPGR